MLIFSRSSHHHLPPLSSLFVLLLTEVGLSYLPPNISSPSSFGGSSLSEGNGLWWHPSCQPWPLHGPPPTAPSWGRPLPPPAPTHLAPWASIKSSPLGGCGLWWHPSCRSRPLCGLQLHHVWDLMKTKLQYAPTLSQLHLIFEFFSFSRCGE